MVTGEFTRRFFLLDGAALAAGASWLTLSGTALAQMPDAVASGGPQARPDGFPRQNPKLVEETVGASHGKFDRVKELVMTYPELAKCSWDGGFGDWEAPIDAASHVGNREIAMFLMDHGARPTLFTFAMLGNLDVVKAMLAAQPSLRKTQGPHGLSLVHHAKAGGGSAAEVLKYLKEIGEAEASPTPIAQDMVNAIIGKYVAEGSGGAQFEVLTTKMGLSVQGEGGSPRKLALLPDGSLHPAGAPSVRFRFEVVDGKSMSAFVQMGSATIRAVRIG